MTEKELRERHHRFGYAGAYCDYCFEMDYDGHAVHQLWPCDVIVALDLGKKALEDREEDFMWMNYGDDL